jgi:hypothetical protein
MKTYDLTKPYQISEKDKISIDIMGEFYIIIPNLSIKILFLFDIDGVACNSQIHYTKEAKLSPIEYSKLMESRFCTEEFVRLIKRIMNIKYICKPIIQIKFNTGRKKVRNEMITTNMFHNANLDFIADTVIYYPEDLTYYNEVYVNQKSKVIQDLAPLYDIIIYIDDCEHLIIALKRTFKFHPKINCFLFKGNGNGMYKPLTRIWEWFLRTIHRNDKNESKNTTN